MVHVRHSATYTPRPNHAIEFVKLEFVRPQGNRAGVLHVQPLRRLQSTPPRIDPARTLSENPDDLFVAMTPPVKRPNPRPARPDPKAMRDRMKAQRELRKRSARLGAPAVFENDAPPDGEPDLSIYGLNAAVGAITPAIDKKYARWLAGRARLNEVRQRQSDFAYYVLFVFDTMPQAQAFCEAVMVKHGLELTGVLAEDAVHVTAVFDTGGQATHFVQHLMKNCVIPRGGDLFLDGRHLAAAMGIELPPPEYGMIPTAVSARTKSKAMAKIPKGYCST